jgi:DNA-binding response OmpR family regulator
MSKKILVVDDNADMREIMQLYMGGQGFTVIIAGDGIEGIEVAKLENPDLIVTDARMPKLDGIEMVKRLRNQPQFNKVPIIIVTGVGSEMQRNAYNTGADCVLLKPVTPSELVAKINALIDSPTQQRE